MVEIVFFSIIHHWKPDNKIIEKFADGQTISEFHNW